MRQPQFLLALLAALACASIAYPADEIPVLPVFKSAGISSIFFQTAYGYEVSPAVGANGFTVGATMGALRLRLNGSRTKNDGTPAVADPTPPTVDKRLGSELLRQNASILEIMIVGTFAFPAGSSRSGEPSGLLTVIAPQR